MNYSRFLLLCCGVAGMILAGCGEQPDKDKGSDVMPKGDQTTGGGHDSHDHGPHGGEVFGFADSGWWGEIVARKGNNLIKIYVLDADKKTAKRIAAAKLMAKIAAKEIQTVEVEAKDADESGSASIYEIDHEQLRMAYDATGFKIEVEIDGKVHTATVKKNPHP